MQQDMFNIGIHDTAPRRYPESNSKTPLCQVKSSFSSKKHKRKYSFKVYDHCVEFEPPPRSPFAPKLKRPKRGNIYTFSRKSRYRLFRLLAKIDSLEDRHCLFFTLTYHFSFHHAESQHRWDLHTFLTRLRSFDPNCQYIWRLEFQKRGAPHFHFIYFPGDNYNPRNHLRFVGCLSNMWHKIADSGSTAHAKYGFKCDEITDYRKACAYLSKYIAKVDDSYSESTVGKHYGNSRGLPMQLVHNIECPQHIAEELIEQLRIWLFKQGKERYADSLYFNSDRSQTIFIRPDEFDELYKIAGFAPFKYGVMMFDG